MFILLRSEELLFERMRATRNGITSYDYIYESDSIVVHGSKCVVVDKLNVSFINICMHTCCVTQSIVLVYLVSLSSHAFQRKNTLNMCA